MNDKVVSVKDKTAEKIDTVIIKPPRLNGYLAFTRLNEQSPWSQAAPIYPVGTSPAMSCPYPLFETRAGAIKHIQDTNWTGSEALIFHVSE